MARKIVKSKTSKIRVVDPKNHPEIDFEAIESLDDDFVFDRNAKPVPADKAAELDQMIDDALGSVTIRLQGHLIQSFKQFATEEGIGYQPLIRQVLTKYASERKRKIKK
ncbi:MAG TPA: hypothetical protein V6C81_08720 [Planktothrix sp.]|jgi:predicted DNA binding CopG/RHH family protein